MKGRVFIILIFSCLIFSCDSPTKKKQESSLSPVIRSNDTVYIEYDEQGNIKREWGINGYGLNGLTVSYHSNGQPSEIGVMENGKQQSTWKYYSEAGVLVRVGEYLNGKQLYTLDTADFQFVDKTINNKIRVKLPKTWNIIEESKFFVAKKECRNQEIYCPNIVILEFPLKDMSFQELVNSNVETLTNELSPNFKIISKNKKNIHGLESYQIEYTALIKDIQIGAVCTFIEYKDIVFSITGTAQNVKGDFLKYKGLFDEIISSTKAFE